MTSRRRPERPRPGAARGRHLPCAEAADAGPIRSVITVGPDGERFIAYDDDVPQGTSDALADATLAQAEVLLIDGYATHSVGVVERARRLGLSVVADIEWTIGPGDRQADVAGGSPGVAARLCADVCGRVRPCGDPERALVRRSRGGGPDRRRPWRVYSAAGRSRSVAHSGAQASRRWTRPGPATAFTAPMPLR